jgi:hypothetical protein
MKVRSLKTITRFYGTTTIQGQKLALHFYDFKAAKRVDDYYLERGSRLVIFALTRRGKSTTYRRVQEISLLRRGWPEHKLTCSMLSLWLNPEKQTTPVVMVQLTNALRYGGFHGTDIMLTLLMA